MNTQQQIAKNLLDIQAVFLRPDEPFTWASGILSPIYCDNRLVLSYPQKREDVINGFVSLIQSKFEKVDMLMGTATAGIPWAAMVADKMQCPMGYVRSSNKSHGKGNKIEGKIIPGANVVVVEDLISTGGSVKDVVKSLQEQGMNVLGVIAIFSYLLPKSEECFKELKCPCYTLSNYDVLIDVALTQGYIKDEHIEKLKAWKQNPEDQSWMNK